MASVDKRARDSSGDDDPKPNKKRKLPSLSEEEGKIKIFMADREGLMFEYTGSKSEAEFLYEEIFGKFYVFICLSRATIYSNQGVQILLAGVISQYVNHIYSMVLH